MNINLSTPINSLGYGCVGRNVLKSLTAAGHKVSLFPIGQIECEKHDADCVREAIENVKAFTFDAPSLRIFHQNDLALGIGCGLRAGYPIFELNKFNDVEKRHLRSLDAVIVQSEWAADVLVENNVYGRISNYIVPLAVDTSIFRPTWPLKEGPTTFLNVGKWEVRKGHDKLIEAFDKAFTPSDDVRLEMLCVNPFIGERGNQEWTRLYMTSKMGLAGKVHVHPKRLCSQREVADVMARADCGVFPARAEGWNLDLAEMLAMGKQVIATYYSAHTEFCDDDNSCLVYTTELEDAFDGVWFNGFGQWAKLGDGQVDQIIEHMRAVHRCKQEGRLQSNKAGVETFKNDFTWKRTADGLASILGNSRHD